MFKLKNGLNRPSNYKVSLGKYAREEYKNKQQYKLSKNNLV